MHHNSLGKIDLFPLILTNIIKIGFYTYLNMIHNQKYDYKMNVVSLANEKKITFAIKVNKQEMKSNNNRRIQILKDDDAICWQREIDHY